MCKIVNDEFLNAAKFEMEPKNFLFVSIDALISDTAWEVVKAGHNVKYFIETEPKKEIDDR